jgi:hypothetical protein
LLMEALECGAVSPCPPCQVWIQIHYKASLLGSPQPLITQGRNLDE